MDLDEPLPGPQWRTLRTPSKGERRGRHWQTLIVGEQIRNKHVELSAWRLLDEPRSAGKGSMSRVKVQCTGCNRIFERRLGTIIQGTSRHCQSCAARAGSSAKYAPAAPARPRRKSCAFKPPA